MVYSKDTGDTIHTGEVWLEIAKVVKTDGVELPAGHTADKQSRLQVP